MGAFLALLATLATVVIMPTTEPGIKIKDTQENSITLQAFQKNLHKTDLYARGYCNEKGKQHKLIVEEVRDFKFMPGLHDYKYECVSLNAEEAVMKTTSTEEVSTISAVEEVSEPEKIISSDCPSKTYIGQEQADGSWATVCKE